MSSTAGRNHKAGPILVTGGTGTLGRLVVPRLQASTPRHDVQDHARAHDRMTTGR
jgi:uncharacterized protein YbjT (DUF2867 family)